MPRRGQRSLDWRQWRWVSDSLQRRRLVYESTAKINKRGNHKLIISIMLTTFLTFGSLILAGVLSIISLIEGEDGSGVLTQVPGSGLVSILA